MTDWLPIYVATGVLGVIYVVFVVRGIQFIQPGELGLLFRLGSYERTLLPGFNYIGLFTQVRRVKVGSGANGVLAMSGVAKADLAPDAPPGPVAIGSVSLLARPSSGIRGGSAIRVIDDSEKGVVLVAEERSRPGSTSTRSPPQLSPLPSL